MQDLTGKITGSTLTAAEWNQLPQEVQNVITALGITLGSGDLNQLGKAIAGYVANGAFYTDSGIANVYVLTPVGGKQAVTDYTDGATFEFETSNPNTGASIFNVTGLGAKNIKLADGSNPAAGQIAGRVTLKFDAANDWAELIPAFEIASKTEAEANTNNTKSMSPLRTFQSYSQFGLGANGSVSRTRPTDCDLVGVEGTYQMAGGLLNGPPDIGADPAFLVVKAWENNTLTKLQQIFAIDSTGPRQWWRVNESGTWSDWVKVGEEIGNVQEWTDVTGSRSAGVVYTNTTGRPIEVYIAVSGGTFDDSAAQVRTSGAGSWIGVGMESGAGAVPNQFIVPDGHDYRLNGASFTQWSELR